MTLLEAPVPPALERAAVAVDLRGNGRVARALLLRLQAAGIPVARHEDSRGVVASRSVEAERHVLVDCTAPHYAGPQAWRWVHVLEEALASGNDVVTANKAPLAIAWRLLHEAAREGGSRVLATATVGGGTPILPTLESIRAAHGIRRIEGSLSGTLSAVCARVAEGLPLADAVWEAQRAGWAEPDPALDLDGTDSWAKAAILHNAAFPGEPPLTLADRTSSLRLDDGTLRAIVASGARPQVVASVEAGRVGLEVRALAGIDPLAGRPGEAVVRVWTERGDGFLLAGPGAGPEATAGSLVADLRRLGARPS